MEEAGGNGNDGDDADLDRPGVIAVAPDGDAVLDLIFKQSKNTLRAAKRSSAVRNKVALHQAPTLETQTRVAYRVASTALISQSAYFARLLGDVRFEEAQILREQHEQLRHRGVNPADAAPQDLPWVTIEDDDEASRSMGREAIFLDIMRILHNLKPEGRYTTVRQVAIAAVLADRFDCARAVSAGLKRQVKWPLLPTKTLVSSPEDGHQLTLAAEEGLRQQIYTFWILDVTVQPRLASSTRALIMHGSRRWVAAASPDTEADSETSCAIWWDLPSNLERELHFRRACILNTIASIPQHFLHLYSSRDRQCKLGYDSSKACDSYQLGEMVRFLLHKKLLFLVDFGPKSLDDALDAQSSNLEIGHIITALKQCPSYQVDKYHTNCGLRARILPILDSLQAMLSANVIAVSKASWEKDRASTSWTTAKERGELAVDGGKEGRTFRFSRALASDTRLRYEGAMAVDRYAKNLFTADEWDWTPED